MSMNLESIVVGETYRFQRAGHRWDGREVTVTELHLDGALVVPSESLRLALRARAGSRRRLVMTWVAAPVELEPTTDAGTLSPLPCEE